MLGLYWLYAGPVLAVCWACTGCMLGLYWLYAGPVLAVCWVCTGCMLGLYWLYAVCWACTGCILGLYWLYAGPVLAVCWVCTGYFGWPVLAKWMFFCLACLLPESIQTGSLFKCYKLVVNRYSSNVFFIFLSILTNNLILL